MNARVSVILPVYNGGPFLMEALNSVLRQTYADWKLVLVDDASTDDSRLLMNRLVHPQVVCHYQDQNLGLYATLVQTIQGLSSEWIAILMQDDRSKPNYLEEMIRLSENCPHAEVYWADVDLIDRHGQVVARGRNTGHIERIERGEASWRGILQRGCVWTISGSFTRRRFFSNVAFRTDMPHVGDYEWLLRAIRASPLVFYERSLTEIRLHAGQASTRHISSGRDIMEGFRVLAQNLRTYPADISRRTLWAICWERSKLAFRRLAGMLLKGDLSAAVRMGFYAVAFLLLPFLALRNDGVAAASR